MQRALKFVRYLRQDNWYPIVLTASPRAYDRVNDSQLAEIPEDVPVHRPFAVDARRLFSVRRRYPGLVAWPDPWLSWWPGAVLTGRRLIERYRPSLIWSTFPINTANLVAAHLSAWSGLPWIADLRDPITIEGYPPDPMRFRIARRIEKTTIRRASRVVFTAEYTRKVYTKRYHDLTGKAVVIPNGFDESNFPENIRSNADSHGPFTLIHSGALQPKGRHPGHFIHAVGRLKAMSAVSKETMQIVFRGSGYERQYRQLIEKAGVEDIIVLAPAIPYEDAIAEMVQADALLVFQGSAYNHAVPAKLYEYFCAARPILGIVDKRGETQRVLESVGIRDTAQIEDGDDIAERLMQLSSSDAGAEHYCAKANEIHQYSRRLQAKQLADLFNTVTNAGRTLEKPANSS